MADETGQKLLDAALKVFAEKGYIGATTMVIAEEAGFSEKTLFRKFKTKKNLFDMVIIQNNERVRKDFDLLFVDKKFENSKSFLETLIKNLVNLADDHFEFVSLTMNESSRISEGTVPEKIPFLLSEYIEKNIQNEKLDYPVFASTILSFLNSVISDKRKGWNFMNPEEAVEKFINNSVLCIR
jgi:TetR/AcrR family transcriptional regulator